MITTAAADSLAGLFAGVPASTGDPAIGAGPAFGQILSANVAAPAVSAATSSWAMPGIATLPIGMLVGTGSLPFSPSTIPAMTDGMVTPSPVTVSGMSTAPVSLTGAGITDVQPAAAEPGAPRVVSVGVQPATPVVVDTQKAIVATAKGPGPRVEAPLPDEVTLDLPVSADGETKAAIPLKDADDAHPLPGDFVKVDRPPIDSARPAGSPVAPSPEDASPAADPKQAPLSEKTLSSGKAGSVKRAESKSAALDKSIVASIDMAMMAAPAPLTALVPSAASVMIAKGDDAGISDDDPSDASDGKTVEASLSPTGAIQSAIETAVVPAKTAGVAPERPSVASAATPHPAITASTQADDRSSTAADTNGTVPSHPGTYSSHSIAVMHEDKSESGSRPTAAQPASFATVVTRMDATAAPVPATATPAPSVEERVTAEPGRMGQEMGVAIARHTATGGGEAMTVRLDPAEFGRIEVTLSFDDSGTIRAVVAAESPAALDLLRRDSADLGRSLAEAGIRSDAQSFRFDTRQGSADGSGQGGQRWQQQQAAGTRAAMQATDDIPEPRYRPLRTSDRVDLMA